MTIYEFAKDYLETQTRVSLPAFPITDLALYDDPHIFSWPPYFTATPGSVTKSDVMKMLAFILQNRSILPNTINFEANYTVLCSATHNFDATYIASFTPGSFAAHLASAIGFALPHTSWSNYARGVVEAASYLESIPKFSYASYLAAANANPNAVIDNLCTIYGMGPALARNFLKEIGVSILGKPDVHLYAVFQVFNPTVTNPAAFDAELCAQAAKAGVSPYMMDRVIWLICSGKYFKHHMKISSRSLRSNFICALDAAIRSGIVTP